MMRSVNILLAEDDADDRSFFHDFLKDRPDVFLLPSVENGVALEQALDAIADATDFPGAIILDQNMPKRNGLQTLRFLKTSTRYAPIPVIIYSTYVDDHLIKESSEAGATLVVSKPTDKAGYNRIIDELIEAIH